MNYLRPGAVSEAERDQTVLKTVVFFVVSVWAIFIVSLFFIPFQYFPASSKTVRLGYYVLLFIGVYAPFWSVTAGRIRSYAISYEYLQGFPATLIITVAGYLVASFAIASASDTGHGIFINGFTDNVQEVVSLGFFLCASFFTGDIILGRLRDKLNLLERLFLAPTLGFGCLAIIAFIFGMMGILYVSPVRIVVIGLGLPGAVSIVMLMRDAPVRRQLKKLFVIPHPFALAAGLLTGLSLAAALLPPWNYDSLLYHLAVPKFYILAHRIYYIRDFLPSNYPLGGEMLFLLSMLIKNDVLAQLVSCIIGCWLILGVYVYAISNKSGRAGAIAVALLLGVPAFVRQLPVNNNDTILALFTLSGVYALVSWTKTGISKWLYLSGFLFGCAAGSKYSGFVILPVSWVLVAILLTAKTYFKNRPAGLTVNGISLFVFFLLAGMIGTGPWLIKNYMFTGNPVYPVFADFIGGRDWMPGSTALFVDTVRNANLLSRGFGGYFSVPWHLTFREPAETTIGPGLLALLPLLLISVQAHVRNAIRVQETNIKKQTMRIKPAMEDTALVTRDTLPLLIPLFIAIGYLAFWIIKLAHVARFALPSIALIIPVFAISLDSFMENEYEAGANKPARAPNGFLRLTISTVLVIGLLTNLFLVTVNRFDAMRIASLPKLSKQFTSNSGLYRISSYINKYVPKNRKIAMVVDNRAYYLNRSNILMLNPLNNGRIDQVDIKSPDRLMSILKQEKVAYVYITDEVRRYTYALPKDSPYRVYYPLTYNCDLLIKQGLLKPVHRNGDFWLYKIAEDKHEGADLRKQK